MSKIFDYADREFGLICCGEMIMRLSPLNNEMLIQGNLLTKQMGGAEFNVASSVSTLGEKTAMLTTLPNNELGKFARKSMTLNGVADDFLIFDDSKYKRMPIYFYEYGSSPRKPNVTYDRLNSSFQRMTINDVIQKYLERLKFSIQVEYL